MAISNYKLPATTFSLEDKKKLCNELVKSKLSRSEFIRQHKLPRSFHNWCNKLLSKEQPLNADINNQTHWLSVVAKEENKTILSVTEQIATELTQINMHCNELNFNFKMPIKQIITFIKELNYATTIIR